MLVTKTGVDVRMFTGMKQLSFLLLSFFSSFFELRLLSLWVALPWTLTFLSLCYFRIHSLKVSITALLWSQGVTGRRLPSLWGFHPLGSFYLMGSGSLPGIIKGHRVKGEPMSSRYMQTHQRDKPRHSRGTRAVYGLNQAWRTGGPHGRQSLLVLSTAGIWGGIWGEPRLRVCNSLPALVLVNPSVLCSCISIF